MPYVWCICKMHVANELELKPNTVEWNIVSAAAKPGEFISLEFSSMVTECSYDYVFVYDGQTYNSPLLGSFSGGTKPDVLVATSQYVRCTLKHSRLSNLFFYVAEPLVH